MDKLFQVCIWFAGMTLLGPLGANFGRRLLPKSGDLGSGVGRVILLTLWMYLYWLLPSLTGVKSSPQWAMLSLVLVAGIAFGLRSPEDRRLEFEKWPKLALESGFFLALSLLCLFVRSFSADLSGSEAFTDFAITEALMLTDHFPPEDRWMSGQVMNYYYLGQMLFVPLAKIVALPTEYMTNLALACVLPLLAGVLYSLTSGLWKRRGPAMVYSLWGIFAGTLSYVHLLIIDDRPRAWIWSSAWVIKGTVVEYPAFAFLMGNLHANYISFPFTLVSALVVLRWAGKPTSSPLLWGALAGWSIGLHKGLNAWAVPALGWLAVVAVVIGLIGQRLSHKDLKRFVISILLALFMAAIAVLPFSLHYQGPEARFGLTDRALRTHLYYFILMWAVIMLPLIILSWTGLKEFSVKVMLSIAGLALAVAALIGTTSGLLVFFIGLTLAGLVAQYRRDRLAEFPVPWILFLSGLVILLGVEFLYLRTDYAFHIPHKRFNTVFKFSFVVWGFLLLAIPYAWLQLGKKAKAACLTGFVITFLFLPAASIFRTHTPMMVLDGLLWLKVNQPDEAAAVLWFRQNTQPHEHLVEATPPTTNSAYLGFSPISTFSGRPAVLGWMNHEAVWRAHQKLEIIERINDVRAVYMAQDVQQVKNILRKYDAGYVVLGQRERAVYADSQYEGLKGLPIAMQRGSLTIFRLSDAAPVSKLPPKTKYGPR